MGLETVINSITVCAGPIGGRNWLFSSNQEYLAGCSIWGGMPIPFRHGRDYGVPHMNRNDTENLQANHCEKCCVVLCFRGDGASQHCKYTPRCLYFILATLRYICFIVHVVVKNLCFQHFYLNLSLWFVLKTRAAKLNQKINHTYSYLTILNKFFGGPIISNHVSSQMVRAWTLQLWSPDLLPLADAPWPPVWWECHLEITSKTLEEGWLENEFLFGEWPVFKGYQGLS